MIQVKFEVKVNTAFGQNVRIVGNHPLLGDWMPNAGLELITHENSYPIWRNEKEIRLPEGIDLEFKIVVMNNVYQLDRWENLNENRIYTTNICKEQVILRMTEDCPLTEELYDNSNQKLQENAEKNYTQVMGPMKIKCSKLLNPITKQVDETKAEESLQRKPQESQEVEANQEKDSTIQIETSEQKIEENIEIVENSSETQDEEETENIPNQIKYFYKQMAEKSEAILISTHTKVVRLKNELKQLSKCLPIQSSNSIFIVYDEQRLDVMRALIFGSEDTPYAHGAFIFDIFIPDEYPQCPPNVSIVSTKNNLIRFNPNLYADGLVCLSLLGTWEGDQSENWNPTSSNLYQILVSIQSLVMNEEVYFNEPYYGESKGTERGEKCNIAYCNIVKYYNISHAICDMIQNPPAEFEQVIHTHFLLKKDKIKQTAADWINEAKQFKECTYDELIESHNESISSRFAENKEEYLNSLQTEVDRLYKLLDELDERANLKHMCPS